MEENKKTKVSLTAFLLIIAILVIGIMGFVIYKLYTGKENETNKSENLQAQTNTVQTTENTIERKNETKDKEKEKDTKTKDEKYKITTTKNENGEEIKATITAKTGDATVTRMVDNGVIVENLGNYDLPGIGVVALVAETGGEYYGIGVYQLVDTQIELIGKIDFGADYVEDADYTVDTKGDDTVSIEATRNDETLNRDFKVDGKITETEVITIGSNYKFVAAVVKNDKDISLKTFRLCQDYITGETIDIVTAGTIKYK